MGRRVEPAWLKGTVGLTAARERGDFCKEFETQLRVTPSTIDRLGLEKELPGHGGCVNCLEWNKDGSVLASASDDLHVILWDPYRYKQLHKVATGHTGNVFSVKFVNQHVIATCAADSSVRSRDIESGATLLECSCHCGRVKRLAIAPDNNNIMWSAGEDGFILQHDMRVAHRCAGNTSNVVVNLLNHTGRYAEAKCVVVNPCRPHMLAVGANDFYVRLYDTRMIKLAKLITPGAPGSEARVIWEREAQRSGTRSGFEDLDNLTRAACQYYAPGHLSLQMPDTMYPKKAVTYLNFSHDGNELVVNLGCEQIYIYDMNSARRPVLVESFIIQHNHGCSEKEKQEQKNGTSEVPSPCGMSVPTGTKDPNGMHGSNGVKEQPPLPDDIKILVDKATSLIEEGKFAAAVHHYNDAIGKCPDCANLYSSRANVLIRRAWSGDKYAAIKDCYRAIKLDSLHMMAHFRLAKALMDANQPREAHECLLYFKNMFSFKANSHAVFLLQKQINTALQNTETITDEGQASSILEGLFYRTNKFHGEVSTCSAGDARDRLSSLEKHLRSGALDHSDQLFGHCNTTTDIKEANFLGPAGEYIAAGSDDGCLFIWCRKSGNIVRCLSADESIVNCVQMHPSLFLLATSGIESVVRLWSPQAEEGRDESRLVANTWQVAAANQQRMRTDPYEAMLLDISQRGGERGQHPPYCHPT